MASIYQRARQSLKRKALSGLMAVVLACPSCATFVSGTTQSIPISSNPPGAIVTVDGIQYGRTPISVNLKRKESHTVSVSLKGYEPGHAQIGKTTNPWILGNIALGGLIGVVVDVASGALYNLSPGQVGISLAKDEGYIPQESERVRNENIKKPEDNSIKERLKYLKELKVAGDITEAQYNKRREELIDTFFSK